MKLIFKQPCASTKVLLTRAFKWKRMVVQHFEIVWASRHSLHFSETKSAKSPSPCKLSSHPSSPQSWARSGCCSVLSIFALSATTSRLFRNRLPTLDVFTAFSFIATSRMARFVHPKPREMTTNPTVFYGGVINLSLRLSFTVQISHQTQTKPAVATHRRYRDFQLCWWGCPEYRAV